MINNSFSVLGEFIYAVCRYLLMGTKKAQTLHTLTGLRQPLFYYGKVYAR